MMSRTSSPFTPPGGLGVVDVRHIADLLARAASTGSFADLV